MHNIQRVLVIISIFILAACGGGGSSPGAATTTIKGVASKGLISNGIVTVFAINAGGSKGAQLGSGSTDNNGAYSISIGSYTGPIIVEASGSYLDEATGVTKTVPSTVPLRAALPNATGMVSLPVTPLTDLAVRQAGTLTAQNITAANTLLSNTFKIDIINTIPAAPTATAFQSSTTTQSQKDYALVLAVVSQQMQTSGSDLATTLSSLSSGISSSGMNTQTAATFTSAATTFIESNPNNQTTVKTITGSTLQIIGSTTLKLTLALQGSTATSVKGIQTTISLPPGASLRTDGAGQLQTGVFTLTGSATNGSIEGNYTPATTTSLATLTIGLISSTNLSAEDIFILNIDLASGITTPTASTFDILSSKLVGTGGVVIDGASLVLR